MLLVAVALLVASPSPSGPPKRTGECRWVYGRFNVWNGSGVRRIWIIGTHRMVALRDDDDDVPSTIRKYVYDGPYPGKSNGLFGNFFICAREHSSAGHMQHVHIRSTKGLIFRGRPFGTSAGGGARR